MIATDVFLCKMLFLKDEQGDINSVAEFGA